MATENPPWIHSIDPEFAKLLPPPSAIPNDEIDFPTLRAQRRDIWTGLAKPEDDTIIVEDIEVPARDGYRIPMRNYRPKTAPDGGSPLVIVFHGGGFCIGDLESEDVNCRSWAGELRCSVVNVEYRLAPEHPYPAAVLDSWDAVKWAASHAADLSANPSAGFIVGGTSAGATISGAIGFLARDEKLHPPLTGLVLVIPSCMDENNILEKYASQVVSLEENREAPILGRKLMDKFMAAYNPDYSSKMHNFFAEPIDFSGFPATFFQICELDPLRDEGLVCEKVFREEFGIKTKMKVYPGLPHAFASFYPEFEKSKTFKRDTLEGIKWLLGKD